MSQEDACDKWSARKYTFNRKMQESKCGPLGYLLSEFGESSYNVKTWELKILGLLKFLVYKSHRKSKSGKTNSNDKRGCPPPFLNPKSPNGP